MKSIIFTLSVLFCSPVFAQDMSLKTKTLAQLTDLSTKLANYQSAINGMDSIDTGYAYEMLYELQTHLDNISNDAYEADNYMTDNSADDMGDVEIVEDYTIITDEEIYDEESEKEYKGDISSPKKFAKKMASKASDFAVILGWGINTMLAENSQDEIKHKLWGSSNWEVGFIHKKPIGTTNGRIYYGLSLNTHYFKLDNTNINDIDIAPGYVVESTNAFDKVRFGVRYLQIPLGFGLKVGKKGELFLGGHAGIKVKGYAKRDYKAGNEEIEEEGNANFGLNKFNYGLNASVGSDNMRFFGKYDLNPVFKDGPKQNILTFGLRYGY